MYIIWSKKNHLFWKSLQADNLLLGRRPADILKKQDPEVY